MLTIGVIPCYKNPIKAIDVVNECFKYLDLIICVDDCCPLNTGKEIENNFDDKKIIVLYHEKNKGVGGAMKTGIKYALELGAKIIVKIDSDGQMSPDLIPSLINPIKSGKADFTKGNRFRDPNVIFKMPTLRFIGNFFLSFLTKLSTGYWELFDPTNGFLALRSNVLRDISLEKIDNGYFFETDLLFRCALCNVLISEIPMEASYEDEKSSLSPFKEFFRFLYKHMNIFFKRLAYQYFLLDFNPGSLSLCLAIIFGSVAFFVGLKSFLFYGKLNIETPLGSQILFLATSLICNQLFISFIYYDASQKPLLRNFKYRKNTL